MESKNDKTTKKASSNETGHNKNLTNFETLIIRCTGFGTPYNPSNLDITIAALTAKHLLAKNAIKQVKTTQTPFNNVEGQRKLLFMEVKPISTKVLNALKGAKAPSTVIDDAVTINRKIQGKRANNKDSAINTPLPDQDTATDIKTKNSVSQQSYDMVIDHFEKLIELIDLEPKYNPNEVPIKVETLEQFKNQLESSNVAVKTAYVPYKNAMLTRNFELYAPETGLVDIAKTVKDYVKSVFGAKSPEFKQISGLVFKEVK